MREEMLKTKVHITGKRFKRTAMLERGMETLKPLITKEEIAAMVDTIAQQIVKDHEKERQLNFIVVLEGAKRFSDALIRQIRKKGNYVIHTYEIKLSSYGRGTSSSGTITLEKDIKKDISGKEVIIIEDLIDTGLTLEYLKQHLLKQKKAAAVKICALLSKPTRRKVDIPIEYLGRDIPDVFIVGYGIDYAGRYRELDEICYIEPRSSL